jgi:Zn-dependent peptidase ImmA (M78 family)/DNA-binding XRE family transcriptional regulator
MTYGDRIRQARELRGLTQADLAKQIGVTQSMVAHLEAGLYEGEEQLREIAFKTGFPPAFFTDPYVEDFPLGSLQFRGHAALSRKDRLQAYRYAQTLYELFRRVSQRTKRPEPRLPQLDARPVDAALLARTSMGLSPDTPVKHLVNAVEHAGVVILGLPVQLEGREAFSTWVGDTPVIALSAGRPGDRLRLSVAHELGHLILHRTMRGAVRAMEKEAYTFGGELLMPQTAMFQELVAPVTMTTLAKLKVKWRVSMQAIAVRARELRIISERQYYYLFEQMGRAGYRRAEPENLAIPIEKPRALRQILEMRYGIPIDLRRLASDTNLTPTFLREIVEAHAEGPKRKERATSAGSVLSFNTNRR